MKDNRSPKNLAKNKYHVRPADIQNAVVVDRERIQKKPFWRNKGEKAWCLSKSFGTKADREFGTDEGFVILFYDKNADKYAGRIRLDIWAFGGMCSYSFNRFYDTSQIDSKTDWELQSGLLETINWLVDSEIIAI